LHNITRVFKIVTVSPQPFGEHYVVTPDEILNIQQQHLGENPTLDEIPLKTQESMVAIVVIWF